MQVVYFSCKILLKLEVFNMTWKLLHSGRNLNS
nr:MAG TPA: hypothetical protein [Crassvirales sp.]